ncbi:MAG: tol-pal system-associated acyl-CoA thioesterase, partial [Burkholderiaceae bacterium]|nr:tol-pal system-associated acyl-CoA thioesterase [Burkholderiaceae bacterium]
MTPDFEITLRIYWEDTDAGGVVFYANYLKFFERARTEWLRALGHSQEQLRLIESAMFVVSDTTMRYRRPARLDDLLRITVKLAEVRRASMTLAQQAWRGDELLTEGTIRIVCVDAGTFQPRS